MIYYQNEFGSRVFFDGFGPAWPKHPCTDTGERVSFRKVSLRRQAKVLDAFADQIMVLGLAPESSVTWLPARITKLDIRGNRAKLEIFNGTDWLSGFTVIWPIGEPAPLEKEIIATSAHRLSYLRADTLTVHSIPLKLATKTSKKNVARAKSKTSVNASGNTIRKKSGAKLEEYRSVDQIANALSSLGSVTMDKKARIKK